MGSSPYIQQEISANYFKKIWNYPVLSESEEQELFARYTQTGDEEALDKLVTSHLRLVVKVASDSKGYGLPVNDLISEGNVGLIRAINKFDPEAGARLSTYATWWIRASINEYILKNWSMVPLGTVNAQRRLFFSLKRLKRELNIEESGELTNEQAKKIARKTEASAKEVKHISLRLTGRDLSLNAPLSMEDHAEHQDQLPCERQNADEAHAEFQELALRKRLFEEALQDLKDRDREIIRARYLIENPTPLKELGQKYGISSERVRQLEVKALKTIKQLVRKNALFSHLCPT